MDLQIIATLQDGTVIKFPFDYPKAPYNNNLDLSLVQTYFICKGENIVCGVDVKERVFVLSGVIVHTDLPQGQYELIAFKRNQVFSDGSPKREFYCFGLKATIDGKLHQRLVFVNPDTSYTIKTEKD